MVANSNTNRVIKVDKLDIDAVQKAMPPGFRLFDLNKGSNGKVQPEKTFVVGKLLKEYPLVLVEYVPKKNIEIHQVLEDGNLGCFIQVVTYEKYAEFLDVLKTYPSKPWVVIANAYIDKYRGYDRDNWCEQKFKICPKVCANAIVYLFLENISPQPKESSILPGSSMQTSSKKRYSHHFAAEQKASEQAESGTPPKLLKVYPLDNDGCSNSTSRKTNEKIDYNLGDSKTAESSLAAVQMFTEYKSLIYNYSSLNDFKGDQRYSIFAIVSKVIKEATVTKTGGYHMNIALVDPSCTLPNSIRKDLLVHIFYKSNATSVPYSVEIGQIVRIHHLHVNFYNAARNFHGTIYSLDPIVKFTSKMNEPISQCTINPKYKLSNDDKKIIVYLRDWWSKNKNEFDHKNASLEKSKTDYEQNQVKKVCSPKSKTDNEQNHVKKAYIPKSKNCLDDSFLKLRTIDSIKDPGFYDVYCLIRKARKIDLSGGKKNDFIYILDVMDGTTSEVYTSKYGVDGEDLNALSQTEIISLDSDYISLVIIQPPDFDLFKENSYVFLQNIHCQRIYHNNESNFDTLPCLQFEMNFNIADTKMSEIKGKNPLVRDIKKRMKGVKGKSFVNDEILQLASEISTINDKIKNFHVDANSVQQKHSSKSMSSSENNVKPVSKIECNVKKATPSQEISKSLQQKNSSSTENDMKLVAKVDCNVKIVTPPQESTNMQLEKDDVSIAFENKVNFCPPLSNKADVVNGKSLIQSIKRSSHTNKIISIEELLEENEGNFFINAKVANIIVPSKCKTCPSVKSIKVCPHNLIWGFCHKCLNCFSPQNIRNDFASQDLQTNQLPCMKCCQHNKNNPDLIFLTPIFKMRLVLKDSNSRTVTVSLNGDFAEHFFRLKPKFSFNISNDQYLDYIMETIYSLHDVFNIFKLKHKDKYFYSLSKTKLILTNDGLHTLVDNFMF